MDSMLHAFIFLAAGVIAVPIATRVGLGSVLGYLIAGALIGPFALKFIVDAERLMHFSEFGVVMMLFLIGLELQPSVLWRMRIPILGLGGLQMLVTTAAIGGIAYGFGQSWQNALTIGLILALSSTAIALQVLDEKNLMKNRSGKSGFAVLLFQDIAVIPIIAFLPLLAIGITGGMADNPHAEESTNLILHLPGWLKAIIVIGSVVGIVLVGRFLTQPLFRYIADSGLRELFTATALMLVMGIALLMNMVGLSPALGAFVAGVVLADSEYRHELEANIDPFKTLLLGLFFISVGASIDFNLLAAKPVLICEVVLGLVAIKLVILLGLGRLFDLKGGPGYWFAFTLAQGGEFGFVLLSFSLQNQVLPKETVDILTAAIALSMVLTPILILLNEKFVQPRHRIKEGETSVNNEDIEDQDDAVIIAGFGRFGQIAGRLLIANDIPVTVLDHSAAHIERVRRFGFKIFYGDASREDLLHTAGAHKAKLLIIAIDDREKTRKIIEIVKHNYPHLKIYTRAYDAIHYHELKAAGADYIEREMFLSSLKIGQKALEALGMRAYQARRQALRFAAHDRMSTDRIGQHLDDNTRFVSETRIAHQEVLELLRRDRKIQKKAVDHAWDASGHD